MTNVSGKIIGLITLLALLLSAHPAIAQQDEPPEVVGIRVGFDGRYKVGQWTPVQITFRGGSQRLTGAVTLTVPDGDGVPSRVTTPGNRPLLLLPGRETTVSLYARFGRTDSTAIVRFRVDGKMAASREFETNFDIGGMGSDYYREAMHATQRLYLVLGVSGMGVDKAVALAGRQPDHLESIVVRMSDLTQLPTRWYGYEGVDTVVLSTSRPELYAKFLGPDDARLAALERWIRLGGRLVFAVGANAEDVLGAGMPLAGFAPGKLKNMANLRHSRGWESYADGSAPFPKSSRKGGAGDSMSVPRLVDIEGRVEAREADLPLVIRTPRGFGQIVFVGADLDRAPFSKWPDRARLVARLLNVPLSSEESTDADGSMMHYGFEDIAGQLRSALDHFSGVRLVPFVVVVGLVIIYLILIGPVDYFFLKKVVGRMQWTWLTFPLVVLVFCVGAYYLAYYLKGDQLRVNQVDMVDVDTTSGFMRGTSWTNIFSPRMETYNLSYRPNEPDGNPAQNVQLLTSWLGLPGSGLGGMNQRSAGGVAWRQHYDFSPDLDAMLGVPIQVWSTKSIMGRWNGTCASFPTARLYLNDEQLDGRITNTLDFPLRNCLLAYDRWVYEFDSIEPGQTVRIKDATSAKSLKTLLTGRHRVLGDDEKQVRQQATPYEVGSTDIEYILRQMMFYKAAGGKSYSHLTNRYQSFVDLSDLVKLDRAVLVGYGPKQTAGALLLRDGQPIDGQPINGQPLDGAGQQHTTVYRFVFKVNADDKNAKSN